MYPALDCDLPYPCPLLIHVGSQFPGQMYWHPVWHTQHLVSDACLAALCTHIFGGGGGGVRQSSAGVPSTGLFHNPHLPVVLSSRGRACSFLSAICWFALDGGGGGGPMNPASGGGGGGSSSSHSVCRWYFLHFPHLSKPFTSLLMSSSPLMLAIT